MSEEEKEGETVRSIVVLDPDAESRNRAEDLEDDLEVPVIAMDSMDFDSESSEEVLSATAFIISWDLGIRSGVDIVEEIRRHATLAELPVIVAMEEPVRSLVKCAMQNGADSVCVKPYDGEEIREKLAAITAEAEAA